VALNFNLQRAEQCLLVQAVLLTNGSVYFGHLQNYGGPYPVLTEVFYVVSQTDPESKQVKSSLIKRGKEMHEPDRMYLNPSQIVFVETVKTNSKVAQLIAQAPPLTQPRGSKTR
jgi:hypothetical protein